MKFVIARTNKKNKLCVSTKTIDRFWERIAKDDAKQTVANFRMSVPLMNGDYQYYNGINEWQHIYPAAEFVKDDSDNLLFKTMNGLVLLTFGNLLTPEDLAEAKKTASLLPMTFAAIDGADGRSLIVLVKICDEQGSLPDNEHQAELLYQMAYDQTQGIYETQLSASLLPEKPSLRSNFLLTLDPSPYYNSKATAMRIQNQKKKPQEPKPIEDLKVYNDFEFLYRKAANETRTELAQKNTHWNNEEDRLYASLSALSTKLCQMGFSEEEAFVHIRRNHWYDVEEEKLRQIVSTAFDAHANDSQGTSSPKSQKATSAKKTSPASGKSRGSILQMMHFLKSRYVFRYNAVMKYTEYRANNSWVGDFKPVDARVQKRMTLEVQLEDIRVSIKDVKNFLESDYIKSYNPIETFLYDCVGKWDGKDRIRALARTVPNDNPHWEDWFYTWFLGMVNQWRGTYRQQYGNSTMPLLISKQGYNKSTFCRRLVPPSLSWGYTDNLILSEKRQVLQGMAQFLLINLDEFNQISPQIQQGFLKNLLQLPTVKIKPPYGSHVQEYPRLASFIATSNMTDILSDPSGNRRFLGVELTGPIDVSGRLNYEQLYAQAMQALEKGEKSYFDAKETAEIMQSNLQFQQISVIKQCFLEVFAPGNEENGGEYMRAAAIFDVLKSKFGSSLQASSIQNFGRELQNIEGLKSKKTRYGTDYLVVKKA